MRQLTTEVERKIRDKLYDDIITRDYKYSYEKVWSKVFPDRMSRPIIKWLVFNEAMRKV